jgi:hypothetical protein
MANIDFTKMTSEQKYEYLFDVVYEEVKDSHTGKLLISTFYCRKVALMLGGNYDALTKLQQYLLRSDIVDRRIDADGGFDKYLNY